MPVATDTPQSGLQSSVDVNAVPVIPGTSPLSRSHVWSWIWFIVAIFVIAGFHVKVFGAAVPPAARFP